MRSGRKMIISTTSKTKCPKEMLDLAAHKCLLTHFPIGHDVIRIIQIEFVNFLFRHEFIDLDSRLLSIATASSSSGSSSMYWDFPTSYPLMMLSDSTSSPVSASTLRYLMRLPVFLLS